MSESSTSRRLFRMMFQIACAVSRAPSLRLSLLRQSFRRLESAAEDAFHCLRIADGIDGEPTL